MTAKRKPSKAFSTRLSAARRWRNQVQTDIQEVLRYCDPPRAQDFSTKPQNQPAETDTFISIGEELATDLAGDLVNYFMPDEASWGEYEITSAVPEEIADVVISLVSEREEELFTILESSNLNDLKPQIMFEAATHGTPAIWVDQGHVQEPIFFDIVPPNELLITPGHLGILDRFRETHTLAEHLQTLLPDADLNQPEIKKKIQRPGAYVKVCWGFWLSWSDPGNPVWISEITVDDHLVTDREMTLGPLAGSCPLQVGRFNPKPRRPWGRGPGIKALPDLATLNKVEEVVLNKLDDELDPAWSYVDDGVLDISGGIESGMAYPRRSPEMPAPLTSASRLDYGFYTKEGMEDRIRTAFYQDGPRQRGDTPPTASQWIDERRRVQARLGKPSAPLWNELIIPIIQRTEYLAVQMGRLPDAISHAGQSINIKAISPLQKSQNQDKAMVSRSNLELGVAVFGENFQQVVDQVQTYQNHLNATGDELTVIRKEPVENEDETPPT